MGFCSPPQLIPEDPPIFASEDPGFEALVGSNMPDPDDLLDGLDAILSGPIGAIDDDVAALATLDVLLAAASFTPGAWTAANVTPLLALYASLGLAGDVLLAGLLSAIANIPTLPTVPPIPPDPNLTLEDLCGECSGEDLNNVLINITEVPGQAPPPIVQSGGDCLNPQAGGGYAPGPCPSQTQQPPPDQPPPDQPPDQGGGDQGSGDQGGGDQPPPGDGGGGGGGDDGSGFGGFGLGGFEGE
jgi:hypothetical protein